MAKQLSECQKGYRRYLDPYGYYFGMATVRGLAGTEGVSVTVPTLNILNSRFA